MGVSLKKEFARETHHLFLAVDDHRKIAGIFKRSCRMIETPNFRSNQSHYITRRLNQEIKYPLTDSRQPDDYLSHSGNRMASAPGKCHVLIVDGKAVILKAVSAMFRKIGYHVTTAHGSAKALLYFGRQPYDLLFTDFDMPVLDGYQLASLIKKRSSRIKVVIMTNHCQAELADLIDHDCIDGWLFKPFGLKDLDAMLTEIGLPSYSLTAKATRM
ncbi:MAG: response regulator [Bacteroides sp.]|nr:response regulator [Bacteroides sp.]